VAGSCVNDVVDDDDDDDDDNDDDDEPLGSIKLLVA
jgi:hypothetical protein